jgi:hypothetical protein
VLRRDRAQKDTTPSFSSARIYRISLGICGWAAENGVLSTAPQTREHRRFKLILASCAKLGRRRLVPGNLPPQVGGVVLTKITLEDE